MRFLVGAILFLVSSCSSNSDELGHNIFKVVPNGNCTITIEEFTEEPSIHVYGFPSNVNPYQLRNGEFITFPICFPSSENYMQIGDKTIGLLLIPGDTISLKMNANNEISAFGQYANINNYLINNPIKRGRDLYKVMAPLDFISASENAQTIIEQETEILEHNDGLPKWFYEYERSRIKASKFFLLSQKASNELSDSAFVKFFNEEFEFKNAFNAYQYASYFSLDLYLDRFNSEDLKEAVNESKTWLVGIDERTRQTMELLPQEYRDINLAHQLITRIEYGLVNRDDLKGYFELFINKDWYKVLENRFPEKSKSLILGANQPYFYLPSISGEYSDSHALIGQNTYINFWSFWCKPCLEKLADGNVLAEKYSGINYVNICLDADSLRWHKYSKENISLKTISLWANANWSEKLKSDFDIMALPKAIISNEKGKVAMLTPPFSKIKLDSIFNSIQNGHVKD
jgi:thiol-disulfide isomerase/thioredoxin